MYVPDLINIQFAPPLAVAAEEAHPGEANGVREDDPLVKLVSAADVPEETYQVCVAAPALPQKHKNQASITTQKSTSQGGYWIDGRLGKSLIYGAH